MTSSYWTLKVLLLCTILSAMTLRTAPAEAGWEMTFQDEFNGDELDLMRWKRRDYWGNGTLGSQPTDQCYRDDAFSLEDGRLLITARPGFTAQADCFPSPDDTNYISGMLSTAGCYDPGNTGAPDLSDPLCSTREVFTQLYGYFEIKARIPEGVGFWPAFWLLAEADWPPEIDILEGRGNHPRISHQGMFWKERDEQGRVKKDARGNVIIRSQHHDHVGPDYTKGFHRYGVDWSPGTLVFYMDGEEVSRIESAYVSSVPMYPILNLAVGGWGGQVTSETVFPSSFEIDYIRVFARNDDGAPYVHPPGTGPDNLSFVVESPTLTNDSVRIGESLSVEIPATASTSRSDLVVELRVLDAFGKLVDTYRQDDIEFSAGEKRDLEFQIRPDSQYVPMRHSATLRILDRFESPIVESKRVVEFVVTNTKNLLANPDFDLGEAGWNTWNSGRVIAAEAVSGDRVAYLEQYVGFEQTVSGLTPGSTCTLSGHVKALSPQAEVRLEVRDYGSWNRAAYFRGNLAWSEKSLRFTLGEDHASARISVYASKGSAYADALELKCGGSVSTPQPSLTFGSTSQSSYSVAPGEEVVIAVPVTPSIDQGRTNFVFSIVDHESLTVFNDVVPIATLNAGEPSTLDWSYIVPEGLRSDLYSIAVDAWNEDYSELFTAQTLISTVTANLKPNEVRNPNFENGREFWSGFGSWDVIEGEAFQGSRAMRVGQYSGLSQRIAHVSAGAACRLSAYARVSSDFHRVRVEVSDYGGYSKALTFNGFEWQRKSLQFQMGSDETEIRLEVYGERGESFVDAINVECGVL
ncbi:MAG: family 16 glycosylhydrolase [Myxococcota bacterium]